MLGLDVLDYQQKYQSACLLAHQMGAVDICAKNVRKIWKNKQDRFGQRYFRSSYRLTKASEGIHI